MFPWFLRFVLKEMQADLIDLNKARASKSWHVAMGQIVYVVTTTPRDAEDYSGTAVGDFRYKYTVRGVAYYGGELTYGAGAGSMKSVLARSQPGSPVKVYYNPSKPSESVLVPGLGLSNLVSIIFLAAITFVVLWVIIETFLPFIR